ncbi:5-oxoprolinase/urea amidolyase family protein [Paraburkholderia sp. UYCP14C]|uniref:5-oxoprolinase subunit B/C family protein n=1 Tax=Paraburkholderia sp. UYCP14C TaxID=2511130 RepID=UPI001021964A|nr:5-oxoprolinase/urea amidolyase family protein [Paraburkholderia sp. UYCP14C]RZF24227.1 5-oxoprolinase/urea amidolyase family protein [Paraburkholderia sp. UYCP14C]
MTKALRFLPAGADCILVEMENLHVTLSLLDGLRVNRLEGVLELVPAACTLLVRFDPLVIDRDALIDAIRATSLDSGTTIHGVSIDIPVIYDGEDLEHVATLLGWSIDELVRRHTDAMYTVAFTGFAPGFAYLTCDDPALNVPRRESPRTRIPAGSVALGGSFSGIYPSDSPGGWQLLGRTPLKMWDISRPRPALAAPGDRIRFRDMSKGASVLVAERKLVSSEVNDQGPGLIVTRCDRPVLFQDLGRPNCSDQGVTAAGALDRASLIEANLCVGNPQDTPALEIALGGFALKVDRPATFAVTGASTPVFIVAADGRRIPAPFARPFALDAGEELTLGFPEEGTRSYLALRGGFSVERVLGSAATDTLSKIGPKPIVNGDVLIPAAMPVAAVDSVRPDGAPLPTTQDTVTIDVLLGPRTDWFTDDAVETFLHQKWQVTAESSRVGMRLSGAVALKRKDTRELPSEGCPYGAIQVPPSGQPVIFLADHPVTGGYPVIAVVARHHLNVAGQIPIGASIVFNAIEAFEPLVIENHQ